MIGIIIGACSKFFRPISGNDYNACELAAKFGNFPPNKITSDCPAYYLSAARSKADGFTMDCHLIGTIISDPEILGCDDKHFLNFTFHVLTAANNGTSSFECEEYFSNKNIHVMMEDPFFLKIKNLSKDDNLNIDYLEKNLSELGVTKVFNIN